MPKVAIVGRPNVGKSSLFNRLTGMRKAIVDPQSGVTRDRIYARMEWDNYHFDLIDTGGISFDKNCTISQRILEQVKAGVDEAAVIIMLVDGKEGINPYDHEITHFLRDYSKPVILAVNKIDDVEQMELMSEFYSLGFERIFPISAVHGLGIDGLLVEVVSYLPVKGEYKEQEIDKITIAGKPNVGKSTLLNAFLKEERALVDSVPGTTRDIIDTKVNIGGTDYILVDTAGIRHKKKFDNTVESYAFMRTHDAICRCDVVLMLLDATAGLTRQDNRILNIIMEAGKSLILIVNKWDLVRGMSKKQYIDNLRPRIKHISFVPVIFISAKNRTNLKEIGKNIPKLLENASYKIKTTLLNKMVSDALLYKPPPLADNKKRLKIYYAVQTGIRPPTITFFLNGKKYLSEPYKRYLVNKIRMIYPFYGSPLIIKTRAGKESYK